MVTGPPTQEGQPDRAGASDELLGRRIEHRRSRRSPRSRDTAKFIAGRERVLARRVVLPDDAEVARAWLRRVLGDVGAVDAPRDPDGCSLTWPAGVEEPTA